MKCRTTPSTEGLTLLPLVLLPSLPFSSCLIFEVVLRGRPWRGHGFNVESHGVPVLEEVPPAGTHSVWINDVGTHRVFISSERE